MMKWYLNQLVEYFADIIKRFESYNIDTNLIINDIVRGIHM